MNNKRKGTMIIGLVLILIGIVFLLNNFGIFEIYFDIFDIGFLFSNFWPLFIIVIGLIFHYSFFTGKTSDAGLLVPGGILLVIGITCQLSAVFGLWEYLWPGFVLSVSVGLFELYIFGSKEKGLLIPVFILGGLSLIFFTMSLGRIWVLRTYLIPLILILGGLLIVAKNRRN
ncbi:MAG: LiaF transmembrane domain-containing protein [Ruminiclostridium sp.]